MGREEINREYLRAKFPERKPAIPKGRMVHKSRERSKDTSKGREKR
jgi:hypothetical protein